MTSKEYIINKLENIFSNFPFLSFRYQYAEFEQMHIVEVTPLDDFENNSKYQENEAQLTYEFDNLFFPESLMFISDDSLTKITKVDFELKPDVQVISYSQEITNQIFKVPFDDKGVCLFGNYSTSLAA